jgi:hypothetical protein
MSQINMQEIKPGDPRYRLINKKELQKMVREYGTAERDFGEYGGYNDDLIIKYIDRVNDKKKALLDYVLGK